MELNVHRVGQVLSGVLGEMCLAAAGRPLQDECPGWRFGEASHRPQCIEVRRPLDLVAVRTARCGQQAPRALGRLAPEVGQRVGCAEVGGGKRVGLRVAIDPGLVAEQQREALMRGCRCARKIDVEKLLGFIPEVRLVGPALPVRYSCIVDPEVRGEVPHAHALRLS